jgi:hypothetical protein
MRWTAADVIRWTKEADFPGWLPVAWCLLQARFGITPLLTGGLEADCPKGALLGVVGRRNNLQDLDALTSVGTGKTIPNQTTPTQPPKQQSKQTCILVQEDSVGRNGVARTLFLGFADAASLPSQTAVSTLIAIPSHAQSKAGPPVQVGESRLTPTACLERSKYQEDKCQKQVSGLSRGWLAAG